MSTKIKEAVNGLNRSGFVNPKFAGSKLNGSMAFNFTANNYFGQSCSVCRTYDLKYSVKNSFGVFCRRCEQKAEFVKREHSHVVAGVEKQRLEGVKA